VVEQLLLFVELNACELQLVFAAKVGRADQHARGLQVQLCQRLIELFERAIGDLQPPLGVVEIAALKLRQVFAQHADRGVVGQPLEAAQLAADREVVSGLHHHVGFVRNDAVGHRDIDRDRVVIFGANRKRLIARIVQKQVVAGQVPDALKADDLPGPARLDIGLFGARRVVVAHPDFAGLHLGQKAAAQAHDHDDRQQKELGDSADEFHLPPPIRCSLMCLGAASLAYGWI
jgi:hypothetical protein